MRDQVPEPRSLQEYHEHARASAAQQERFAGVGAVAERGRGWHGKRSHGPDPTPATNEQTEAAT